MNMIQVQLTEKQYEDLLALLERGYEDLNTYLGSGSPCLEDYDEAEQLDLIRLSRTNLQAELTASKTYLWDAGFISLELDIPAEVVDAVARSGDNEPAVKQAIEEHGYLRRQLNELDLEDSREYLTEAGIDEVDGMNTDTVLRTILWMACHEINDNEED